MSFFENLEESADVDFLERVQQTQKELGNAKEGEALSSVLPEKRLMFGDVDDGDEEEDFFKEFALEDLDAPSTHPSVPRAKQASRSNGPDANSCLPSFNSQWEVDGGEISSDMHKSEIQQLQKEKRSEKQTVIEIDTAVRDKTDNGSSGNIEENYQQLIEETPCQVTAPVVPSEKQKQDSNDPVNVDASKVEDAHRANDMQARYDNHNEDPSKASDSQGNDELGTQSSPVQASQLVAQCSTRDLGQGGCMQLAAAAKCHESTKLPKATVPQDPSSRKSTEDVAAEKDKCDNLNAIEDPSRLSTEQHPEKPISNRPVPNQSESHKKSARKRVSGFCSATAIKNVKERSVSLGQETIAKSRSPSNKGIQKKQPSAADQGLTKAQKKQTVESKASLPFFRKRKLSKSPGPDQKTKHQKNPEGHMQEEVAHKPTRPLTQTIAPETRTSNEDKAKALTPSHRPSSPLKLSKPRSEKPDISTMLQKACQAKAALEQLQNPAAIKNNPLSIINPPTEAAAFDTADNSPEAPIEQTSTIPPISVLPPEPSVVETALPEPLRNSRLGTTEMQSADFSEVTHQLELITLEAKLMREQILETRVRLAIQTNKFMRLHNPIVVEKLSKLKAKAEEIMQGTRGPC